MSSPFRRPVRYVCGQRKIRLNQSIYPDFEFLLVHMVRPMALRATFAVEPGNFNRHEIASWGDFNGFDFVVNGTVPLLAAHCARDCNTSGNRDLPKQRCRSLDVRKKRIHCLPSIRSCATRDTGPRAVSSAPSLPQHLRDCGYARAIRHALGVGLGSGSFRLLGVLFFTGGACCRFSRTIVYDPA